MHFGSFGEVLQERARSQRDTVGFTFLDKSGEPVDQFTYAELHRRAGRIAHELRGRCDAGARVMVLLGPGLDFVVALFGCWYAGVVPVPALPPEGAGAKRALPRLAVIASDAGCRVILTTEHLEQKLRETEIARFVGASDWVLVDHCKGQGPEAPVEAGVTRHPAILQYTSGSTGAPKGVVLTHASLLANSEHIRVAFGHDHRSQGVIWLPPHHDMGLVGGVLQPAYAGFPVTLMSPMTFLQRPVRWLEAVSRYRATTSGGPDFAYRMCVERISEEERRQLNLESWSVAFTGSEAVRADTLNLFAEAFGATGFRKKAFFPCYGLAEATLMVTGVTRLHGFGVVRAERDALAAGRYRPAPEGRADALALTSCGAAIPGQSVVVVEPSTSTVLPEGVVGEILCSGPNVAEGYWGNPEETLATFGLGVKGSKESYLRTGDLGFFLNGELFITGRTKDLIIVRGKNHYPGDLEATVESALSSEQVPLGAVCAFALHEDGRESIALCVEVRGPREQVEASAPRIAELCRIAVAEHHGIHPARVVILRPGAIPKTTSGKIQRRATCLALANQELEPVSDFSFAETAQRELPSVDAEPPSSRREVVDWLIRYAAAKRGVEPSQVDTQAPFASYGLDSLEAVSLASELAAWLRRPVPATALWEHTNIDALATFAMGAGEESPDPAHAESTEQDEGTIAIVGMGCRVPGATDPHELWQLLRSGRHAIGSAPRGRHRADELDATGREAGYLTDVESFDSALFEITPDEADAMDPQQRLLLEVAWEALESAGMPLSGLRGSNAGVFVGISNVDYQRVLGSAVSAGAYAGTGNAISLAANRISYAFDWTGPSIAVDTACSSSLVAAHLACNAIRAGECEVALAGGVNLILAPDLTVLFDKAGMLSPTSRCRSFEQGANGYVRGEGCGVVVLKSLERALADGDRVFAVIRGSAVNQDGRSNGITAPSVAAQRACISAALRAAGASGQAVRYVETHGTGTPLGDPIEVQALSSALARSAASEPCFLGAIKANIGHLEAAAGIVGLIKAALVVHHGEIPPQPDFDVENERLELGRHLLVAKGEVRSDDRIELAGVSSFGFGGTNAHVVLGRVPERRRRDDDHDPGVWALRLSARSDAALRALALKYHEAIASKKMDALRAISRVSLTRRNRLATNAFVLGTTLTQVLSALQAVARGSAAEGLVVSPIRPGWLWACEDIHVTTQFLEEWSRALPRFASSFRKQLDSLGTDPENAAALSFCAHLALADAFGHFGVTPAAMTGSGIGEIAAAAWSCDLALDARARLFRFCTGLTTSAPAPSYVASPRRFLREGGRRTDRVDAYELREAFLGRAGERQALEVDDAMVWGKASGIVAARCQLPLATSNAKEALTLALAALDLGGVDVDWPSYLEANGGSTSMPEVEVPKYAFDRQRHWLGRSDQGARVMSLDVAWREAPLGAGAHELRRWLLVGDEDELAARVASAMISSGALVRQVARRDSATLDDALREDWHGVLLVCPQVDFRSLDVEMMTLVNLWRRVEAIQHRVPGGLRVVTRGAYAAQAGAVEPGQTALWGLFRTLSTESPHVRHELLDVGSEANTLDVAAIARRCVEAPEEHCLLRGGTALVQRLVPRHDVHSEKSLGDGCYVVTGGLGALGLSLARWLVERGAKDVALVGRQADRSAEQVAALRGLGVEVTTHRVDVSSAEDVRGFFQQLTDAGRKVRGVVHAAGVLDDGLMSEQTLERFRGVTGVKVRGAEHLVSETRHLALDFLCFVSSIAAVFGAPGQGAYSPANAYLDGLASRLRLEGIPAFSVAFGPLSGDGMARNGGRAARQIGLRLLEPAQAMKALGALLAQRSSAHRVVVSLDAASPAARTLPDHVRRLTTEWSGRAETNDAYSLRARIERDPSRGTALLSEWIRGLVAEQIRQQPSAVPLDSGLLELGLDSLMIQQLRSRLQVELSLGIDAAVLFAHPTIARLATHLSELVSGKPTAPALPVVPALGRITPEVGGDLEDFLAGIESLDESEALELTAGGV